ncbi:phosphatase PAP2 family protein [Duganella aquatilis]|nr:phosphatase PAP2 family protein [Duganella aquatilis]
MTNRPADLETPPRVARYTGAILLFVVLLAALMLFGMLAEDVAEGEHIFFDEPVLHWLRGLSNGPLDLAMKAITWLGSVWAVAPLLALALWRLRRERYASLYLLLANAGAALLNLAAKHGFARIRPTYWEPMVHETSYSFPSGHAMETMALVASLWLVRRHGVHRGFLLLGVVYVGLVGVSRMYLGVHYPSDVLAGWCAAFCWCHGLAMAMRHHDVRARHQLRR